MHRFSNAISEPRRLWYDLQQTTGCGSLRADAVRFLPASLPHSRSYHCQCYCLLHHFARVIHHRSVSLPRSIGRVPGHPRSCWLLAKAFRMFVGAAGPVRAAKSAESRSWGGAHNSWGHGRIHLTSELWRNPREGLRRVRASEGHSYRVSLRGQITRWHAASLTNPFQTPILRLKDDHDRMPVETNERSSKQARCDICCNSRRLWRWRPGKKESSSKSNFTQHINRWQPSAEMLLICTNSYMCNWKFQQTLVVKICMLRFNLRTCSNFCIWLLEGVRQTKNCRIVVSHAIASVLRFCLWMQTNADFHFTTCFE